MFFRKRWIALLATVVMSAGAAMAVGSFTQVAKAQNADAGKDAAATPATPATPVAPPPVSDTTKEEVENPYGFGALVKNGDFVTRGVLIVLGLMSLGTWYIMFTKFFEQLKLGRQAGAAKKSFWTAGTIADGIASLSTGSPFRYIAETGVSSTTKHEGALLERIDLNSWISMSIQRAIDNVQSRLQDGLAFLGTVGSTSPFVGLFGTVWGIYGALTAIGIAGQASIDKVAGPVGEALLMTAFGLFVAVPAVLGYNFLVRRNKVAMESVRAFGADLHLVLLGQTGKSAK
jgi:biopolymer transport protein ExbB